MEQHINQAIAATYLGRDVDINSTSIFVTAAN
jgi:hypothetical protein